MTHRIATGIVFLGLLAASFILICVIAFSANCTYRQNSRQEIAYCSYDRQ